MIRSVCVAVVCGQHTIIILLRHRSIACVYRACNGQSPTHITNGIYHYDPLWYGGDLLLLIIITIISVMGTHTYQITMPGIVAATILGQ